jgi:hypothetical protein
MLNNFYTIESFHIQKSFIETLGEHWIGFPLIINLILYIFKTYP